MEAADENPPSAGGSSSGDAASGSNALTPKAAAVKGIAKIKISTGQAAKVIAFAKENNNAAIFITPEITGGANEVTIELPTTMLASMAANTNADLQVQVPMGMVTIPHNALSAIASAATGDDIVITVTRKSASDVTDKSIDTAGAVIVEVTVASNGKAITDFGGARLVISIPVDDTYTEGQSCRVIIISADGGKKIVYGKCIKADGKLMVQVTVTHLSTFIVSGKTPMPFTDVSGHWALEAITCAWDNDLTNGVGGRLFDPEGTLNRAAFVTMLYRLEGSPAVAGAGSFSDVSAGQWYTNAVIWAAENKIANGMGGGTFAPFTEITREQMAVMLMHYADYKKYDVSKANDLTGYADAGSISAWALGALKWANAEGLIKGRSLTAIAPDGGATRAEAATILMRFAESHK